MKLARVDLLDKYDLLKPAIATKDMLVELVHIFHDGETAVAYNDLIGIEVPLKTDFKGGLRGSLLLGVLSNSRARDVEIAETKNEGELLVRAAGTRLTLGLLDLKQSVWKFPNVPSKQLLPFGKDLLEALPKLLISVGNDVSTPEQLGVTVVDAGDHLDLYSTDSKTISWCRVTKPDKYNVERVTIPTPFCEQLLRLCKGGGRIAVMDDMVVAENEGGVRLFARLVDTGKGLDFEGVIGKYLPKNPSKGSIEVPARLKLALDRVGVLLDGQPGVGVRVSLDPEYLKLEAKTEHGEIRDQIPLEQEHRAVSAPLDHALLKRALPHAARMTMTEDALVFLNKGYTYLAAARAGG